MALTETINDHDEALHESLAWALAEHRLGRPESEIFPAELKPKDWERARVALDAIKDHFGAITTARNALEIPRKEASDGHQ